MVKQIGLITSVLVLLTVSNVRATIVELPLDCAGIYKPGNPGWEMDFDLGVEFTDIAHVYIDWEGEITGGKTVKHSNDDPVPEDVGITAILGDYPSWRVNTVWGGASTYPNPEYFCVRSELLEGSMFWTELLEGKVSLRVFYDQKLLFVGYYVEAGTVTLNDATLFVDGDVVPEPVTILLLAMGTLSLRLRRRNN